MLVLLCFCLELAAESREAVPFLQAVRVWKCVELVADAWRQALKVPAGDDRYIDERVSLVWKGEKSFCWWKHGCRGINSCMLPLWCWQFVIQVTTNDGQVLVKVWFTLEGHQLGLVLAWCHAMTSTSTCQEMVNYCNSLRYLEWWHLSSGAIVEKSSGFINDSWSLVDSRHF